MEGRKNISYLSTSFISLHLKFCQVDRAFAKRYSVEIPKLDFGENVDAFEIDSSFFAAFEHAPVQEGNVHVDARINKRRRFLEVRFEFKGHLMLQCDRCLEPYRYELEFEQSVVYSYDEELEFETDEVVLIDENDPYLNFANDLYDFVALQTPLRKVPPEDIHTCPDSVLKMLGLKEGAEADTADAADDKEEIDPRWAALKKLKDNL